MKITTVKLIFKGKSTTNEIYTLYIHNLIEAINLIRDNDLEKLEEAKNELENLKSMVMNKILRAKGHTLAKGD